MYYADKTESLREIFGAGSVKVERDWIVIDGASYPVLNDVIVLSRPGKQSPYVREALGTGSVEETSGMPERFAEDVQYSFGQEWKSYGDILKEHGEEFRRYFDIVDMDALKGRRLCDLGCGNGRWSYYLKYTAREIVLVDFSDAIFKARENLAGASNCLFFMCDIKDLPFKDGFADFLFCLGVLHHMPSPCLEEVRKLRRSAPELLVYLYYSLEDAPAYFRAVFNAVDALRRAVCRIRSGVFRKAFSFFAAAAFYMPLIILGRALDMFRLGKYIPLYRGYKGKSLGRIQQDAYDRFFTPIEQRVSREEIMELKDTFREVIISDGLPYWHFLCKS